MLEILNYYGLDLSGLFNGGNVVLLCMGFFWLAIASIQDFRHREVENWWTFTLIAVALAFRAFLSIEQSNYWILLWGLIGIFAFFVIEELFYYSRMFAGGDAKLLLALGAILPLGLDWKTNVFLGIVFLFLIILAGSLYGLVYSFILVGLNFTKFRKEFSEVFREYKKITYFIEATMLILFLIALYFNSLSFILLSVLIFFSPLLLIFAKALENSCMSRFVRIDELTVGDWLVKPVKIISAGKIKIINPYWEGLDEKELGLIQKNYPGKVLVKYGIPFVPAFLLAFMGLIWILNFLS